MLALRLIRGSRPPVLLRRLLVAAATAGVGFLLLSALGHAAAHPEHASASAARLAWCVVPLTALVQLTVAVARTETDGRALTGLDAAGMGPTRLPLLAAVSTAASALPGSVLALLLFLHLRGDLAGGPVAGAAADLLGAPHPLPVGAMLILLAVAPVAAVTAGALTLRPRSGPSGQPDGPHGQPTAAPGMRHAAARGTDRAGPTSTDAPPVPAPAGLPWGAALAATGLAVQTLTSPGESGGRPGPGRFPLPGALESIPPGVVAGWLLTALGLVLAGPGLTHLCGRLICLRRPGALRLLSGRLLQEEAGRLGRPLGMLCAVAAGALAAAELYGTAPGGGARVFGPLTALGVTLVMCCATASCLTTVAQARELRAPVRATLLRLGASRSLLVRAAGLRAAVVVAVLGSLTWVTGELAVLPLRTVSG